MTDRPQPRAVVPDGVTDPVTVGVDYGTLSGRAVIVRVSDGEELGSAVCEYPHAVLDRSLPAELAGRDVRPRPGLGAPGACGLRAGAQDRSTRGPRRRRRGPQPGHRHRHRLHRLHDGAHDRRRHPAVRAARPRRRAARLRQALEAPRRPAAGRPHQRAGPQARRGLAAPVRRADLLGVGVRQGPRAARGGAVDLRRDGALRRGGRLDRLAAVRLVLPQRLHRGLQGHLPGRHLPDPGVPRRAQPGLRRLRRGQARRPDRPARRRRRATDQAGRRVDRPARGHHRGRRQRRRPRHRAGRRRDRRRPDGRDHGHVDLPRDEQRHAA